MYSDASGKTTRLCALGEERCHSDRIAEEDVLVFDIEPGIYTIVG
jgi:hypothetical protein